MQHWRAVIPNAFIDIQYEHLVQHADHESQRLFHYCDLQWQQNVLQFHTHTGATATASAAQVRQPLYRESIGKWRHYSAALSTLMSAFDQAGICYDEP
jgi:hypothetical protein